MPTLTLEERLAVRQLLDAEQRKLTRPKKLQGRPAFAGLPGFVPNPLRGLPKNMKCPCGGKRKFKRCCLLITNRFIPGDALPAYRALRDEALAGGVAW